ncbi:MAG: hypothetical protein KKE94_07850 [Gammaproteobacteria bacterium]|nr:hypothetical protein [Gammaproteobacteria bacterium]
MKIQPALKIERDEDGLWTHPDYPEWDEGTKSDEIAEWEKTNSVKIDWLMMDGDASDELVDAWFEGSTNNCSEWQPKCEVPGSFLLSIHDTEDGPVALFAIPQDAAGAA